MPWNLLILPLVGGYFILTKCFIFKFHQQRLDRQRLIFESVLLAIALIVSTYLIRILFIKLTLDLIHSYAPFKQPFALTSLISIGVAIVFTLIYNKLSEDKKWIRKAINFTVRESDPCD